MGRTGGRRNRGIASAARARLGVDRFDGPDAKRRHRRVLRPLRQLLYSPGRRPHRELSQISEDRSLTDEEHDELRRIDWPYYHADPTDPPSFLERETCAEAGAEGLQDTRRLLA